MATIIHENKHLDQWGGSEASRDLEAYAYEIQIMRKVQQKCHLLVQGDICDSVEDCQKAVDSVVESAEAELRQLRRWSTP
jgi:hypothetical protein